jgi:hypothetical protein
VLLQTNQWGSHRAEAEGGFLKHWIKSVRKATNLRSAQEDRRITITTGEFGIAATWRPADPESGLSFCSEGDGLQPRWGESLMSLLLESCTCS